MSDTGTIEISHLPLNILEHGTGNANPFQNGTSLPEGISMDDHLRSLEKE